MVDLVVEKDAVEVVVELFFEGQELAPIGGVEDVVGVQPEYPFTGAVLECKVAGGGKVLDPVEVEDLSPASSSPWDGAVSGSGVYDDEFIARARWCLPRP